MISVHKNKISLPGMPKPKIESVARKVLMYLGHSDSDLTIYLTNNLSLKKLNKQYRGIDETTDVLSFSYNEKVVESERIYLGDIIISLEFANLQAIKKGCDLMQEVQLLIVHGILHLLGYDHNNYRESKQMFTKQENILSYINN